MADLRGMKAVLLAGGLGSRLSEETSVIPKPMVTIGGRPILWHIMKLYHQFGVADFIVCLGYKGYVIKDYFTHYEMHESDVTVDLATGEVQFHERRAEPWRVTMVETGEGTMTAGRLKRVSHLIDDTFLATYGDGVADVDVAGAVAFHRRHGRLATVTTVVPPGRYGAVRLDGDVVTSFMEKPEGDGGVINGGFFVFEPAVLDAISSDQSNLEEEVLPALAAAGELMAYPHAGFWQAMDTLRDRRQLEAHWAGGNPPWKSW